MEKDTNLNPNKYPYKESVYFCQQCLEESASKKYCKYFWCKAIINILQIVQKIYINL